MLVVPCEKIEDFNHELHEKEPNFAKQFKKTLNHELHEQKPNFTKEGKKPHRGGVVFFPDAYRNKKINSRRFG